jgi:hypothetical protein
MGARPRRTASLISGWPKSEPAECTVMSSWPPVASRTSSAKDMMFCVWNTVSP